jgi:hypothetical protein
VTGHFAGQKVGVIYQNDDVGQGALKGIPQEIPKSAVVAKQPYSINDLLSASGLANQVSAMKSAGAQVVVVFAVNFGASLILKEAAQIGYKPQFVMSNIGADPPTVGGLLGPANTALQNGVITDGYLPSENNLARGQAWCRSGSRRRTTAGTPVPKSPRSTMVCSPRRGRCS